MWNYVTHICDTTSRLHGNGKRMSVKKFKSSEEFRRQSHKFLLPNATKEEILEAGEKALLILYNAKKDSSLDSMRHKKFLDKVATKIIQVDPCTLPPTSSSAKFHILRVYLQCQQWRVKNCDLNQKTGAGRKIMEN